MGFLAQQTGRWRSLPAPFWIVVVARFVNGVGAFSLAFLSLYLVRDGRLSVESAGLVLAAFGIATIPSRLVGGWLTDRLGGRTIMAAGLGATCVCQIGLALAHTPAAMAGAAVALGLAFEIYEPPSAVILADRVASTARALAFGVLALFLGLAGVLAGLLAAIVAGAGLRWLFVIDGATSAAAALVVAVGIRPQREPRPSEASEERYVGPEQSARRLWAITAGNVVFATLYLQLYVILPLTITDQGGPPGAVGIVLAVSASLVFVVELGLTSRLARVPSHSAMTSGYLIFGLGLCLNGLSTDLPEFVGAAVLWTSANLLIIGRLPAIISELAVPERRGRHLAIYGSSWGIGATVAPLLGTTLVTHFGATTTWLAMGIAAAFLAPFHACLLP